MNSEYQMNPWKHIIAAAIVTGGILLWTTGDKLLISIGSILIAGQALIWGGGRELLKPLRFRKPEWTPRQYLTAAIVALSAALILILFMQLPEDRARALFTKWYFSGAFWLLAMAVLAKRYVNDREGARQPHGAAASDSDAGTESEASHA